MEGKVFRSAVYRTDGANKEFDQAAFDKIWPHLRVLARSSPDDKLTLAHGLNQSNLFADKAVCQRLKEEHGINIFPDRQVRTNILAQSRGDLFFESNMTLPPLYFDRLLQ
jgi:Ca2+ transporting ATPase